MSIVEVCGFNDWLLAKLQQTRCSEIVVIQPDSTAVNKTDKRDANALSELLWNNRKRLPAAPADAQARQLANFRQHLAAQRTRVINKIKDVIPISSIIHRRVTPQQSSSPLHRTSIV